MKRKKQISLLTLELYHNGLATYKERKMVEKALKTDSETRKWYEAVQDKDGKIRQLFIREMSRHNIEVRPDTPADEQNTVVPIPPAIRPPVWGIAAAAAILIFAGFMVFNYLRKSGTNELAVTEDKPGIENDQTAVTGPIDDKPVEEIVIAPEPARTAENVPETKNKDIPNKPEALTAMPPSALTEQQFNIPADITSIFEGMFVNRELSHVNIPESITLIEKNAFAGNPLISVTIGANVTIDDEALPGNFTGAYNRFGRAAGTYTRTDVNSEKWEKK